MRRSVAASSRGNGLGTEGTAALLDRGSAVRGVRRLTASTIAVNAASRRVLEETGIRLVRHFVADQPGCLPGDGRSARTS
jgi:Acetyltransferases, including N-acetylases of ribosomal proteins